MMTLATFGLMTSSLVIAQNVLKCDYETVRWDVNINRDLRTCYVGNLVRGSPGNSIDPDQRSTVEAMEIQNLGNVKFLPNNIGEKFPNLLAFKVHNCPVKNINNLEEMSKLVYLGLDRTDIKSLPRGSLDGLPKLEWFRIFGNEIDHIDANVFNSTRSLKVIYMRNNHLRDLDENLFRELKNLEELNLQTNKIKVLSPKHFTSQQLLKRLDLGENEIKVVDEDLLANLRSLEYLSLAKNRIQILNPNVFTSLSNLEDLNMANNQIKTLPEGLLGNLVKLQSVSFAYNQLKTLPKNFFSTNTNLNYIWLYENQLEVLSSNLFNGKTSLKSVDLTGNKCINDSYGPNSMQSFPRLREVLISNCQASDVPSSTTTNDLKDVDSL